MHPPPNDRPTGKEESDGEKNHADFREKRALPFLWRKKASFKKAKHGAHHQLQNNRQENEMPKLLPSSPTRKRCVFFKRLEEVVHLLYVNFLRLFAREPFLQLPPSTNPQIIEPPGYWLPYTHPWPNPSSPPAVLDWRPSIFLRKIIGPPGFEPGTSSTPRKRATRLRYGPYELEIVSAFPAARKPELPPGFEFPRVSGHLSRRGATFENGRGQV